jgi:hypothetical protein
MKHFASICCSRGTLALLPIVYFGAKNRSFRQARNLITELQSGNRVCKNLGTGGLAELRQGVRQLETSRSPKSAPTAEPIRVTGGLNSRDGCV